MFTGVIRHAVVGAQGRVVIFLVALQSWFARREPWSMAPRAYMHMYPALARMYGSLGEAAVFIFDQ